MELTLIPWYRHTVNKHKDNLVQVIFYYLNWHTHRIYKLHKQWTYGKKRNLYSKNVGKIYICRYTRSQKCQTLIYCVARRYRVRNAASGRTMQLFDHEIWDPETQNHYFDDVLNNRGNMFVNYQYFITFLMILNVGDLDWIISFLTLKKSIYCEPKCILQALHEKNIYVL